MKVPFVDLKGQYNLIKSEIDNALANVINDSAFIGGKCVANFEQSLARTLQCYQGYILGRKPLLEPDL